MVAQGGNSASTTVPQGSDLQYQVTVTNVSSSSLNGVTLRMVVPRGFSYLNTASINEEGDSVRAADVSPKSRQSSLTWGAWTIGPGLSSGPSQVVLTAELQATGSPGGSTITPQAFATGLTGSIAGAPLGLTISAAPSLNFSLSASPNTVAPGQQLTYRAVITNTGAGSTPGPGYTSLGITLPSDFDYLSTSAVSGNADTGGADYPTAGSGAPVWAQFDIPGAGPGGPGILSISFEVQVLADVPAGTYTSSASVVADTGSATQNFQMQNWSNQARVVVTTPPNS